MYKKRNGSPVSPYGITYRGTTSYQETFDEPGTYSAIIKACKDSECSSWSGAKVNEILPYTAPNRTGVRGPSSSSTGSYTLTWGTPWGHGISRYQLERSVGNTSSWNVVQNHNSLSYNENVSGNGTYYYRIKVCNIDDRCSDYSSIFSVNVSIPKPPGSMSISGPAYHIKRGTYTYSWSKPSGDVDYYEVEKSYGGSVSSQRIPSSNTSYQETFNSLITYVAKIRACNDVAGCGSWSASEVNIVQPYTAPNRTGLNGVSSTETANFTLTWSKPWGYGINSYVLERLGSQSGSWQVVSSANTLSYNESLSTEGTYSYRIKVCNIDNYCSGYSDNKTVEYKKADTNTPPVVSITSPSEQATIDSKTSVIARATASDSDGSITSVQFSLDNTSNWVTDTTAPYEHNFGSLSKGTHVVYARAIDNKGEASDIEHAMFRVVTSTASIYSITEFGATANNDSDDDAVAINEALNEALQSGASVYIPPGVFHVKTPIVLRGSAKLTGESRNDSVIVSDLSSRSSDTIEMHIDSGNGSGVTIERLSLVSKLGNEQYVQGKESMTAQGTFANGIRLSSNSLNAPITLKSLKLVGFSKGIVASPGVDFGPGGYVGILTMKYHQNAIELNSDSNKGNILVLDQVYAEDFLNYGVYASNFRTIVQNSTMQGKSIEPQYGIAILNDTSESKLYNLYFEGVDTSLKLSNLESVEINSLFIQGAVAHSYALDANDVKQIKLSGYTGHGDWGVAQVNLVKSTLYGSLVRGTGAIKKDLNSRHIQDSYEYQFDDISSKQAGEVILNLGNIVKDKSVLSINVTSNNGQIAELLLYYTGSTHWSYKALQGGNDIEITREGADYLLKAKSNLNNISVRVKKIN
ncbi:hypothetical protein BIW53_06985 [Pseudoalteromonas byunsanensis]|uniref:Fibronectin type-III domain-containing protein n=1 Tax=Pseudoalteromonas byunsanensis TaxID=327939 RepID=A0A1S1N9T5_9GAMM|nr:hypothetical protein BIW53_06985 [Pseudoalteromonas byunsanensis]